VGRLVPILDFRSNTVNERTGVAMTEEQANNPEVDARPTRPKSRIMELAGFATEAFRGFDFEKERRESWGKPEGE